MTPCAYSADARQTTGTTEYDALIWAEMMTGTSTLCAPLIILSPYMVGFVGLFVRWKGYAN